MKYVNLTPHDVTVFAGMVNPVMKFAPTGTIARLEAMKQLGIEKAECVVVSEWSEDMEKQYRILDNRSSESNWDFSKLSIDLSTFDAGILLDLFPEVTSPEINLDDYKIQVAENSHEGEIGKSVFLKVECANVTDAERAKALLIENGFKMVTVS